MQKEVKIKVIIDKDSICAFEKEIDNFEELNLLKYSQDFEYKLICVSEKGNDIYFINKNYISTKKGYFKSKNNLQKILGI